MQVFKAFFKSARKHLPVTLMYFLIFCAIAVAAANNGSDPKNSSFKTASLEVGIIDEDNSAASETLCNYLETMHTLTPLPYDNAALLDGLFYRTIDYILILPDGFENKLLSGAKEDLYETVQIPGVYSSAFIDEQIQSFLKTIKICLTGGFSPDQAFSQATATLTEASNQVQMVEFDDEGDNDSSMTEIYYLYQFLAYVIVSMILTGLTPILTIFQEKNIAKRTSCSSISLLNRNLQIAFASVIYCLCIWALFIITFGVLCGTAIFSEKGLLCIANSFLLLPVGVSLSLVVACFSPSGNTINMINNVLTLGMSFLCGIFIPQQILGENVLAFSKYLPLYWYIKNNDMISGFGNDAFDLAAYQNNLGIQALYGIAIFAVALAISKYKSSRQKA